MTVGIADIGGAPLAGAGGSGSAYSSSWLVVVDGAPYSEVVEGSISITSNLESRDTLSVRLYDPTGSFSPSAGDRVHVFFRGFLVFGGTIESTSEVFPSLDSTTTKKFIDLECVDFNQAADRRLVTESITSGLAGDIVRFLFDTYLSPEGVLLGTIEPGVAVGPFNWNFVPVATCLDRVAQLLGYYWNIDHERRLHFRSRTSSLAPWPLDDANRNRFYSLTKASGRGQYRNHHVILGGKDLGAEVTRYFRGDGNQSTFDVEDPLGAAPRVFVESVEQTVGLRGVDPDDDPDGFQWFWKKGTSSISQNRAHEPVAGPVLPVIQEGSPNVPYSPGPPEVIGQPNVPAVVAQAGTLGDLIEVRYRPLVPIVDVAIDEGAIADRQAAEGGTGRYEAFSTDSDIEDASLAAAFGDAFLRQHARINTRVSVSSVSFGVRPGQLQTASLALEGLSGDFLVLTVQVQDRGEQAVITYDAIDNVSDGGWQRFFKDLLESNRRTRTDAATGSVTPIGSAGENISVTDTEDVQTGDSLAPYTDDPYTVGLVGSAVTGYRYLDGAVNYNRGSRVGALLA